MVETSYTVDDIFSVLRTNKSKVVKEEHRRILSSTSKTLDESPQSRRSIDASRRRRQRARPTHNASKARHQRREVYDDDETVETSATDEQSFASSQDSGVRTRNSHNRRSVPSERRKEDVKIQQRKRVSFDGVDPNTTDSESKESGDASSSSFQARQADAIINMVKMLSKKAAYAISKSEQSAPPSSSSGNSQPENVQ